MQLGKGFRWKDLWGTQVGLPAVQIGSSGRVWAAAEIRAVPAFGLQVQQASELAQERLAMVKRPRNEAWRRTVPCLGTEQPGCEAVQRCPAPSAASGPAWPTTVSPSCSAVLSWMQGLRDCPSPTPDHSSGQGELVPWSEESLAHRLPDRRPSGLWAPGPEASAQPSPARWGGSQGRRHQVGSSWKSGSPWGH